MKLTNAVRILKRRKYKASSIYLCRQFYPGMPYVPTFIEEDINISKVHVALCSL